MTASTRPFLPFSIAAFSEFASISVYRIYGLGDSGYPFTRKFTLLIELVVFFGVAVLAGFGAWIGFRVVGGKARRVATVAAAAGGALFPGVLVVSGEVLANAGLVWNVGQFCIVVFVESFTLAFAASRIPCPAARTT